MNSHVIKVVAGGGKTTLSEQILKEHKNGLYLAYTNSVINRLRVKGYLCRTIDSLFASFIIPKFTDVVPIIHNGSKVEIVDYKKDKIPSWFRGAVNIKIKKDGSLYYNDNKLDFDLNLPNYELYCLPKMKYFSSIKYIFSNGCLHLSQQQLSELSSYLLSQYSDTIIKLIGSRFSFIVFDEAQDFSEFREDFADIIYKSDIEAYILGDCNQNIIKSGDWFEKLEHTEIKNRSFRCPETNCKWIREHLGIDIYGNSSDSFFQIIDPEYVFEYDDGSRYLLYASMNNFSKPIINSWSGPKNTIKSAKGSTIDEDIVILGKSLDKRSYYTAITRTKKNVFSTVSSVPGLY